MASRKLPFVFAMVCIAILLMLVLGIIAIIGAMDLTNGCLYRYSSGTDWSVSSSDQLSSTVTLKASGNYTALASDGSGGVELDPNAYGQWLNTNVRVTGGQKIKYSIRGELSLCKAYLPTNNLQSGSNTDGNGDVIVIPRTDDRTSSPVTLYLSANTGSWRNLTELFPNDHVVVSLMPDQKTAAANVSMYNSIEGTRVADCQEGARSYDPICGRFSLWDSSSDYVSSCLAYDCDCFCSRTCSSRFAGQCVSYSRSCSTCTCYSNVDGTAPEPYANDGSYTSPWRDNLSDLITNFNRDCTSEQSYVDGAYQNEKYFWFSADNAAGLLYRKSSSSSASTSLGSDYEFAEIDSDQSFYTQGEDYKIILNTVYADTGVKYLQYRLYDDGSYSDNTGGYVLNIRQTKCRRSNGNAFDDTLAGRGVVQYVIANYGDNPNTTSISASNISVDSGGDGEFTAPSDADGYLWMRIKNDENDYKDSFGQYTVQFFTTIQRGWFYDVILEPFFNGIKGRVKDASTTIFKNITCYQGGGESLDNCTSFFTYVKAILILYIMLYGMMFLMGMVKITQTDLVIRVIKIGFVAGLMNDTTFNFFNTYVFDFVTNFSDEIISNMSGYSTFSSSTSISNPFMFLSDVMTKIFLSSTFAAQIMALFSMGLNGMLYFVLIFVCLCIVIIVTFKAIAVYVMAFMAITILIGIAPLFLTFILFERTWHLFDNWLKFTFRYMLEPVIVLAGLIILTQLFTIYLDYVIGYSVCWKCALEFKLPFPQIDGITPAFLDVPIFCIYWFAPWGFDSSSGEMGLNMQNIVVMLMLAYCMWGYIEFSRKIVAQLVGSSTGPSATGMGSAMASRLGDRALSKVGLDARSRAQMIQGARNMRANMRSGKKINPAEAGRRHDKGDHGGGASQGGAGGGAGVPRSNISGVASEGMRSQGTQAAKVVAQKAKSTWGSIASKAEAARQAVDKAKRSIAEGVSSGKLGNSNKSSKRQNLLSTSQLALGGGDGKKGDNSKALDKDNQNSNSVSSSDSNKQQVGKANDSETKLTNTGAEQRKEDVNTSKVDGGKASSAGVGAAAVDAGMQGSSSSQSMNSKDSSSSQIQRSDGAVADTLDKRETRKSGQDPETKSADQTRKVSDDKGQTDPTLGEDKNTSANLSEDSAPSNDSSAAQVQRSDGGSLDSLGQREKSKEGEQNDSYAQEKPEDSGQSSTSSIDTEGDSSSSGGESGSSFGSDSQPGEPSLESKESNASGFSAQEDSSDVVSSDRAEVSKDKDPRSAESRADAYKVDNTDSAGAGYNKTHVSREDSASSKLDQLDRPEKQDEEDSDDKEDGDKDKE